MNEATPAEKLALLVETANWFNTGNRGWDGRQCSYGKDCAIGRLITDPKLKHDLDNPPNLYEVGINNDEQFELMPPNVKRYGQTMLEIIQSLHDREGNWTEKGLSLDGWQSIQDEVKTLSGDSNCDCHYDRVTCKIVKSEVKS